MVIPYLGSIGWYVRWLKYRLAGVSSAEAAEAADAESGMRPRDYCRTIISDSAGEKRMFLTVPVAGGASAVKRGPLTDLRVSQHGNWQHNHIQALRTLYGRLPYAVHYLPDIEAVLSATPVMLQELTAAVHEVIAGALDVENLLPQAIEIMNGNPERIPAIAEGMAMPEDEISILAVLLRYGPEAIFPLLSAAAE